MSKKVLLLLAVVIVLPLLYFLFRPAPPPPPTTPCDTPGNPLCIHVIVGPGPGGKPAIQEISDRTVKQGATVFWKIDSAGYYFPQPDAIDFANPGAGKPETPAPQYFTKCDSMPAKATNGTLWRCTYIVNPSKPGDKFPYKVNVTGPDGKTLSLDPYIVNG